MLAAVIASLSWITPAAAHIRLGSPPARYEQNDNGLKTAPCGSGTPSKIVTSLVPGQALTVSWKESVAHAGHYRIALSSSESDFTEPTDLAIASPLPTASRTRPGRRAIPRSCRSRPRSARPACFSSSKS